MFDDRPADRNPSAKTAKSSRQLGLTKEGPAFAAVVDGRAVRKQLIVLHIPLAKASNYSEVTASPETDIGRMSHGDMSGPLFSMQDGNTSKAHVAPKNVPACERQNKIPITRDGESWFSNVDEGLVHQLPLSPFEGGEAYACATKRRWI